MARALGCCSFPPASRYRSAVKLLHAETFKPHPEISEELAELLRAGVRAMHGKLSSDVVELAGGTR